MKNEYWISNAVKKFINLRIDSRIYILHKRIAEILKENKAKVVLDFGAGEGFLAKSLVNVKAYDYFDVNPIFYKKAKKVLAESDIPKYSFLNSLEQAGEKKYDAIVISLVLLTIYNKEEIVQILSKLREKLSDNGFIIVADTHPCFRDKVFSTFHTEFSMANEFDYFKNKEFSVYLRTNNSEGFIAFKDYHYTLSDYFNFFNQSKLKLAGLEELKDSTIDNNYFSNFYSPYILFKLTKN